MTYVLGVDVGSQSVKGVLLDGDGALRASASYALTMKHPRGGWAEQDPRHWEEGLASVIAGTLAGARVAATRGQPRSVSPVRSTASCRSQPRVKRWVPPSSGSTDEPRIKRTTSPRPSGRSDSSNITGLVPDASHSGPKIMWLRDHEPDDVRSARPRFLRPPGIWCMRLTGRLTMDHANASSSLLYDLRARRWSDELLEGSGLASRTVRRDSPRRARSPGTLSAHGAADHSDFRASASCSWERATSTRPRSGRAPSRLVCVTDVTGTAEPVTVGSDHVVLDHEGLVETHAHALRDRLPHRESRLRLGGQHPMARREGPKSDAGRVLRTGLLRSTGSRRMSSFSRHCRVR